MKSRDIDNDDRDFIAAHAQNGLALLSRYHIVEPTKISPAKIAGALGAWRADSLPDRPAEIDVIRALGCLFGHLAVTSGIGKWVVVTDSFGTTLGIQNASSGNIIYPLDAVSKRTLTEPCEELISIYDVFALGLPDAFRPIDKTP